MRLSNAIHPRARRRLFNLTPRAQEAATLVTQGHSNREMAAALGLAEWTVENHIANILYWTVTWGTTTLPLDGHIRRCVAADVSIRREQVVCNISLTNTVIGKHPPSGEGRLQST